LSSNRVEIIAEHIRTNVDAVNTHDDPRHGKLYTQGFILGHLASIFHNDPRLYREFLEHCDHLAQKYHKKIDMHRK